MKRDRQLAAALLGCVLVTAPVAAQVSAFGRYSGYSEESYDGWTRGSEYVEMADGTPIAVDVFLPTASGVAASEPLPVVLRYTRYYRALEEDGEIVDAVEQSSALRMLLRHGYAVAVADARGTGASFGVHFGAFSVEETADAFDLVEWLAARPWSNGKVGMEGRSYPGTTQYLAAASAPPSLVAIFPEMAGTTFFDFIRAGGTYKSDFIQVWSGITRAFDLARRGWVPARVDADADGSLRDAAVAEHSRNLWAAKIGKRAKTRDWTTRRGASTWSWESASPLHQTDAIEASGVAIYHVAGWYDLYPTQQPLLYANLHNPQRMMIGPWTHTVGGGSNPVYQAEMLRWFDFWLKGVPNGVMREKPIHYFLMRGDNTLPDDPERTASEDQEAAEDGRAWRATKRWPPKARTTTLHFAAGTSGTVASVNDGRLVRAAPTAASASDDYVVDYTSRTGSLSRWMVGYDAERADRPGTTFFDERTSEDEKALTFTSDPLTRKLTVVGYPVVHVWLGSTHRDGDLFVYLEEIDADGRSHYVSEGALRASYRALGEPPWGKNFGLPFHRGFKSDLAKLPAAPVELVLDLLGTATLFDRGHRVRLTLAGADVANHQRHPDRRGRDAPRITVLRDRDHPSRLELPVTRK